MPDKFPLKFHKLEMVIIELSNDFGSPLLRKLPGLFSEIYWRSIHVDSHQIATHERGG